ncbi:MAG TPA: hypothetical protein VK787_05305 [Puia sp.]|nr:hypothetical protein [Puia sp.]
MIIRIVVMKSGMYKSFVHRVSNALNRIVAVQECDATMPSKGQMQGSK